MFSLCLPKSGSRNSTHNKWNIHANVIQYMGNWCCMVDKYRVFIILLIWLKSSRHMIWLKWKVLDTWCSDSKSNSIDNANYILHNTRFWEHKKFFVTISIILFALSINQQLLKLEHPTVFLTICLICYYTLIFVYIINF